MTEMWTFPHANPIPRGAKTLIMGIVNLTPDSFSGRNAALNAADALRLATAMIDNGADMIDLGAESSRPGAQTLSWREETARLGDVVRQLRRRTDKPISVDTYHAETARYVLEQGADIINDITALRGGWSVADSGNTAMAEAAAEGGAHVVLMHMPSAPAEMQTEPRYADAAKEVREFLLERADLALRNGIARDRIWLDPGFGFGKNFHHNRELLLALGDLSGLGFGVLAGLSRKRMIADALGLPVNDRLEASLALAVIASLNGADIIRVHDVPETVKAVAMADAIRLGI